MLLFASTGFPLRPEAEHREVAAAAAAAAEGDEGRVEPRAEVLGLDVEADERRSDRFLEHHRGGEDQVAGCQRRRKDG